MIRHRTNTASPKSADSLGFVSTRSLTADESERVRVAMFRVLADKKSQTAAAAALGVSQSAVSETVQAGALVGPKIARAVAAYLGITFDELVSGVAAGGSRELRHIPGFDEALAEAIRRLPGMEPQLRALAQDRTPRRVERITPELLISLAAAWAQARST